PRDQQHAIHADHRIRHRRRLVVVEPNGLHAAGREVGDAPGVARARSDVGCGDAAIEQGVDDETAEVAGGSGDEQGHEDPFHRYVWNNGACARAFPLIRNDAGLRMSPAYGTIEPWLRSVSSSTPRSSPRRSPA